MISPNAIHFSALVVAYNEDHLIKDCLKSLSFCEDIILIDLGSKDNTVEIAKSFKAKIVTHPWVPIGEQAKNFGLQFTKNDWVIVVDPDERVSPSLIPQIRNAIQSDFDLGIVYVPWKFYFLGEKLTSTRWGYVGKIKGLAIHKSRVTFGTLVNSPYFLKTGFSQKKIPFKDDNELSHLWVTDIKSFIKKHWKYIKMEGEAQYIKGNQFSFNKLLFDPWRHLKINLINYRGLTDGWRGIFLSFFMAWFAFMNELSLWNYSRKIK